MGLHRKTSALSEELVPAARPAAPGGHWPAVTPRFGARGREAVAKGLRGRCPLPRGKPGLLGKGLCPPGSGGECQKCPRRLEVISR